MPVYNSIEKQAAIQSILLQVAKGGIVVHPVASEDLPALYEALRGEKHNGAFQHDGKTHIILEWDNENKKAKKVVSFKKGHDLPGWFISILIQFQIWVNTGGYKDPNYQSLRNALVAYEFKEVDGEIDFYGGVAAIKRHLA